jgi:hypothetical protein
MSGFCGRLQFLKVGTQPAPLTATANAQGGAPSALLAALSPWSTSMSSQTAPPHIDRQLATVILAGVPVGVFALDWEWRFLYLNGQAERFFQRVSGRTRDYLLGKSIWEECPEVADSTFAREYHQASEEDRTFELEVYYPGLNRWFSVMAPPVQEVRCFYFQEITDRIRMQRELRLRRERLADVNPARVSRALWPAFTRRMTGCNS